MIADLVGSVLRDLRLARLVEAEERRLLAVLLEDDADRLHRRRVRRGDADLERRRGADELLGFFDGDGRRGHPAGDDPGAARGEEEDQDESDEVFHPLIIVGLVALNRTEPS